MNRMILWLNLGVLVASLFLALSTADSQIGILNSTSEAANAPRLSRRAFRDESAVAYLRVVQALENAATKSVLDALTVDQLFAIRTAMIRYQSVVSGGVLRGLAEGGDARSVRERSSRVRGEPAHRSSLPATRRCRTRSVARHRGAIGQDARRRRQRRQLLDCGRLVGVAGLTIQNFEWRRAIDHCLKCGGDTCWTAPGSEKCWAVNSSDSVPVLIALGARFRLLGPDGVREIDAAEMFDITDGREWLTRRPDELLTDILVPPQNGAKSVYLKRALESLTR